MAATVIDAGRRIFANLKAIIFTPWINDSTLGTSYDLVNIVGDSTSIEQDENEVNEIAHEFSSEPLYENINLGRKNFSTECVDFQNDVLKNLFGWEVDDSGNLAAAPIVYEDLYCKVELQFNSTEDVLILPKVKLNSRAVISSMKTDASRGNITGTCYSAYVKVGTKEVETDMAIVKGGSTATISPTPTTGE